MYDPPAQEARKPFEGSSGEDVSSALPDDLRSFTSGERGANDLIRNTPSTLWGLLEDFASKCKWGSVDAGGVITAFGTYITSNDADCVRLDAVASAFEAAGGAGVVSTVANSAIAASVAARGVSEQRQELEVPTVQTIGSPPTSGYSNDPVNTATGNFVKNEEDLRFWGASSLLGWARSYSSLGVKVGGHGPGWSSFADSCVRVSDEGATWTQVDGREVFFPRVGEGFGRAEHENYWLESGSAGFVVVNNAGARWEFTPGGQPTSFTLSEGATIFFDYEGGRLAHIRHVRGRRINVEWDGDLICAVCSDDGRRIEYAYEDGRLVAAGGPAGTRRYEWGEQGLICAVIDADGVVEARNTYDSEGRVVTQLSPFGRLTRFAYLPGRVSAISDADGSRSNTWVADERGRLVAVTDTDGNTTRLSWDRWGNQVMALDAQGRRTVREFDERGRMVTEMLPSGAMTCLSYDGLDRLTSTVSVEDGREVSRTTVSYEADQCQPSEIVDGEGGITRMVWDAGLLVEATDPTGVRVSFEYDRHGDLIASTDGAGNVTRVVRDECGRPVQTVTPLGARTCFEYDEADQVVARVDPDGGRWAYEYSAGGRLRAIVNPLGARTTVEFGPQGELSATVDPLGRRVTQEFDDLGNVSRVRLPDGAVWEFTHDAMSRLTQTVDPSGGVWTRAYDQVGRLTQIADPVGRHTTYHHDSAAGEVKVGDLRSTSVARMDRWGRHVATVLPDGSTVSVVYDRAGRPIEYVDAGGGRTTVERDAAGRPTRVRRPTGASVRYDYDECGRLAGITNALGFRTALVYDEDSRVVERIWPTADREWFRYDQCGRVTAHHQPGAGTWRWEYDKAGRITQTKDPQWGLRRFRYDEADQLTGVTGGTGGVTSFGYDANGRATTVIDPMGGVTRQTFDAMDRCTSVTDPLGNTMRASYDAAGRLTRNVDADEHTIDITYEGDDSKTISVDGRLFSRTRRDAAARTRTIEDFSDPDRPRIHVLSYDSRGLLVRHDRGAASTSWTWNADGACTSRTTPNGEVTRYHVDEAGHIVSVEHAGIAPLQLRRDQAGRLVRATAGDTTYEWTYHNGFMVNHRTSGPEGSRAARVDYTPGGLIRAVETDDERIEYAYDDANQMTRAVGPNGLNSWAYDIDWTRTFDAASRILSATSKNKTITYTYDRSGRRTAMEDTSGRSLLFEWTGLNHLASITAKQEDGSLVRTTTLVDALGQLARVDNQELFFDIVDGTPAQVTGQSQVNAGPLTATTNGWATSTWHQGRDTCPANPYRTPPAHTSSTGELGLGADGGMHLADMEWLGARVYDPASSSFLSPDPLPPVTGAGWAANPYSYAGNNPATLIDPTGLRPITTGELDAYRKANSPKWGTALAIIAGVGLAFVPGAQGLAAALIAGAVLGSGASVLDQACSGYPINWTQVATDTLFGLAGGALGYGIGKGIQWAANTPTGQAATTWVSEHAQKIPGVKATTDWLTRRGTTPVAQHTDNALQSITTPANTTPTPQPPTPPRPATVHLDGLPSRPTRCGRKARQKRKRHVLRHSPRCRRTASLDRQHANNGADEREVRVSARVRNLFSGKATCSSGDGTYSEQDGSCVAYSLDS